MLLDNKEFVSGETWEILSRVLCSDTPLLKTQYFDVTRSTRNLEGEVSLWLSVLATTMEDWITYNTEPITALDKRKIREIEFWPFSKSFRNVIDAIDIAFKIESEVFIKHFREWLDKNKANLDLSDRFDLQEPLESSNEIKELRGETKMKVELRVNVPKPEKAKIFQFAKIEVGGGLIVKPEENETLKEVAAKVRAAVSPWKKSHPDYNLSVHVDSEHNQVIVFRNPTVAKEESNEADTSSN